MGIFDNVGLNALNKKETHPHILVLSSKKDATIPEISFGFSVIEDRNNVEKKLKSMIEVFTLLALRSHISILLNRTYVSSVFISHLLRTNQKTYPSMATDSVLLLRKQSIRNVLFARRK